MNKIRFLFNNSMSKIHYLLLALVHHTGPWELAVTIELIM